MKHYNGDNPLTEGDIAYTPIENTFYNMNNEIKKTDGDFEVLNPSDFDFTKFACNTDFKRLDDTDYNCLMKALELRAEIMGEKMFYTVKKDGNQRTVTVYADYQFQLNNVWMHYGVARAHMFGFFRVFYEKK